MLYVATKLAKAYKIKGKIQEKINFKKSNNNNNNN